MLKFDLSRISKKEWVLIYIFAVLIIASVSYNFIFYPLIAEIKSISGEIARKKADIQRARIKPQSLERHEQEIKELRLQMDDYHRNLRALTDVPYILKGLNQLAEQLNIKFVSVTPLEKEKILLPGDREYLLLVPIRVRLKSGFHELGAFINQIESSAQFMKVTELKIDSDPRDIWLHQIELVITSFGLGADEKIDQGEI